jgi:uncharacterized protein (TIGR02145 family)
MRIVLFFLLISTFSYSQIIQPSYHAGYQAYAPPIINPSGGNAICDATTVTVVNPITSSTGKIWMDRNLGASRAATAQNDYQAFGCLYQWGRGNDGHASINWTSSSVGTPINGTTAVTSATDTPANALFIMADDWRSPQNNSLWQGLNGINNPCPSGYRIPTEVEFNFETSAYTLGNIASAYSSIHKFVLTGYRDRYSGNIVNITSQGNYWTSTLDNATQRRIKLFTSSSGAGNGIVKGMGAAVRCIKD